MRRRCQRPAIPPQWLADRGGHHDGPALPLVVRQPTARGFALTPGVPRTPVQLSQQLLDPSGRPLDVVGLETQIRQPLHPYLAPDHLP